MTPFLLFISLAHFCDIKIIIENSQFTNLLPHGIFCLPFVFHLSKHSTLFYYLLPLCLIPSSENNLSHACRLYGLIGGLTSILQFPRLQNNCHARSNLRVFCFIPGTFGDVSARCLVRLVPIRFVCCPHGTNIIILPGIVMGLSGMERVGGYSRDAVLYGSNCTWWEASIHSPCMRPVIFFRTVTRVCHTDIR